MKKYVSFFCFFNIYLSKRSLFIIITPILAFARKHGRAGFLPGLATSLYVSFLHIIFGYQAQLGGRKLLVSIYYYHGLIRRSCPGSRAPRDEISAVIALNCVQQCTDVSSLS